MPRMTQAEADALLPILRALPDAHRDAMLRHLYRLEDDAPAYDSVVQMLMEIGATKAEAHASVDRAMIGVRH